MDDEKTELLFIFWKEGCMWSSGKIKADGKLEIWKSMMERAGENVERSHAE